MENIIDSHIKRKKFCHGYLFYGDKEKSDLLIQKLIGSIFCENLENCGKCYYCKMNLRQNPDFFNYNFPKFGVKESALLKETASQKAYGEKKIFLINLEKISNEAQNALLKILEEPRGSTYFLIYSRFFEELIPTLKSRLAIINSGKESSQKFAKNKNIFEKFSEFKDRTEAKNFLISLIEEEARKSENRNYLFIKKLAQSLNLINENLPLNLIGLYLFF